MRHTSAMLALVLLGLSAPAKADCGDYGDSLLSASNCDADSDVAGWIAINDTFISHEPLEGLPPGSARMASSADRGDAAEFATGQFCTNAVSASTGYSLGASIRLVSGAVDFGCLVEAINNTGLDCTEVSSGTGGVPVAISSSEWTHLSRAASTESDTVSMTVSVACQSDQTFEVLVDNVYLIEGAGGTPIFYDGFEDGDLEHW